MRSRASLLLGVIYLGFISLGLPDGAFGVAWPAVYPDLHVPIGLAGTFLTAGTLLAGLSGFSSGWIIARFRTGPVVLASGLLTATGLLTIGQARSAAWLFAAAVPLGFGAGAVDAGLNGYVAKHYAGRHMNWLHACWGIGATSGPLIVGSAISGGHGWRHGYLLLSLAQYCLAAVFLVSLGWWRQVPERVEATVVDGPQTRVPTLGANSLPGWLSPLIFAFYVAAEMTTGLWVGTVIEVGRGHSAAAASICTACFYGAITVGRIAAGFFVEHVGNRRAITVGVLLALASLLVFALGANLPVAVSALALAAAGLGFAPVYPCLMHEVPRRFAPSAVQTIIGRQSGAGNLGIAVVPAVAGAVAQAALGGVPWLVLGIVVVLIASIRTLDRLT